MKRREISRDGLFGILEVVPVSHIPRSAPLDFSLVHFSVTQPTRRIKKSHPLAVVVWAEFHIVISAQIVAM